MSIGIRQLQLLRLTKLKYKKMIKSLKFFIVAAIAGSFIACSSGDDPAPVVAAPTGSVNSAIRLHFETT